MKSGLVARLSEGAISFIQLCDFIDLILALKSRVYSW